MILKNRLFERKEPERDASLFIIYCEGSRREPKYFEYFEKISSRVKLEIIKADSQGNNSPSGLLKQAKEDFFEGKDSLPKYFLGKEDKVWFVIDTDRWGSHIPKLRKECQQRVNWFVAQSNPCFEVWLFYHFFREYDKKLSLHGNVTSMNKLVEDLIAENIPSIFLVPS